MQLLKKSPENKQTKERKTTNKTSTNPQKTLQTRTNKQKKTLTKSATNKNQKQKSQTQPKTNRLPDVIYILCQYQITKIDNALTLSKPSLL